MAKIRDFPLANYPAGTFQLAQRATPNGLAGFDLRIGRCTTATPTIWPNASTRVTLDLQFSFDGGASWTPLGGNSWSQVGGIIVVRGVEVPEDIVSWRFAPDEPTHVRGQITLSEPTRSYLDITVV